MDYTGPGTGVNNSGWSYVGKPDFSAGAAEYESLCISNGTPYVAYEDVANNNGVTVMKFTGVTTTNPTGWTPVGSPGFTNNGSSDYVSLCVDNGTPYVAFSDGYDEDNMLEGPAAVMKFTGIGATGWQPVGSSRDVSQNGAAYESLFIYNGTPYLAYQDEYAYDEGQATVMKYTLATGWQPVGSTDFTNSNAYFESLCVSNNTPYLAFEDGANSDTATVMDYTGTGATGWQTVGNRGFSDGEARYESFCVANGTPYVAYMDWAHNYAATVMDYTGPGTGVNNSGWSDVGSPGFSTYATYESLCSANGTLYLAFDNGNATVMEAVSTAPALATTPTAAPGTSYDTTAVTATPNTSGDTLAVEVSASSIPTPNVGDPAPTGAGVTNPYTSGNDISGVSAGDYVGVYEVNSGNTIVAFSQIGPLTSSQVNGYVTSTTGSATVDPAYGGAVSLGSAAGVNIPANALKGSTPVTVAVTGVSSPPAPPSGFEVLGNVYDFTVDGGSYTFNGNVTLTFTFTPSGQTQAVYYYDGTSWQNLGGNVSGDTITVTVDHFTEFAVISATTQTYTVTYSANSGSGAPPVDPKSPYQTDATVTVLDQGSLIAPLGDTFGGWSTAPNAGTAYQPGAQFTMGSANVTLYAVWNSGGGVESAPIPSATPSYFEGLR